MRFVFEDGIKQNILASTSSCSRANPIGVVSAQNPKGSIQAKHLPLQPRLKGSAGRKIHVDHP